MKRLSCFVLAVLLCVSLCACSLPFGATEHVHTWLSATCTSPAVCETCGEPLGEPLPHNYGQPVVDLPAGKITSGKQHSTCMVCGFQLNEDIPALGSEGLIFERNEDGAGYTVTGLGSCTDTELFIPAYTGGLPVTAIGVYAFKDCEELTDIHIPETVTELKAGAFAFCYGLTEMTLPNSIVTMGASVFVGCKNLHKITMSNHLVGELDDAFSECESLREVTIPLGVTSLTNSCFRSCKSLQSIQIPEGVTVIGRETFLLCKNLQKAELPGTVTDLEGMSFSGCYSLTQIIYDGTMAQWEQIRKSDSWDYEAGDFTVVCTDGQIPKNGS